MGLLDFFKGKRDDEDALQSLRETEGTSLASEGEVMQAGGLAEVNVSDDIPNIGFDPAVLLNNPMLRATGLGGVIAEAITSGNVQGSEGPVQTIDLRGTGARELILGVLGQHGVEVKEGRGQEQINVSGNPELQKQILDVLKVFGVDPTPQDPND